MNLTILIYFVPYLYLFLALPRLRPPREDPASAVVRVPGRRAGLYLVTVSGSLATLVSLVLVFIPPAGTENVLNYEANLILQAIVMLGVGLALYRSAAREPKPGG